MAKSTKSKAERSAIARKAAAKAIKTKRANGTLSAAAKKATATKRANGNLSDIARKASATRKANLARKAKDAKDLERKLKELDSKEEAKS